VQRLTAGRRFPAWQQAGRALGLKASIVILIASAFADLKQINHLACHKTFMHLS
jgi:hypothetical protein